MRKRLSSAGLVALIAWRPPRAARQRHPARPRADRPDPQHHYPTAPPARPAATPYDGVTFPEQTSNPVIDTDEDRVSTFAMDVDTASYTIAQRYVARRQPARPRQRQGRGMGQRLRPGLRRIRRRRRSRSIVDAAPAPFIERGDLLLRIGIKARDVRDRARPDAALTFVIDTSGSMGREERLELVKDSLRKLVLELGRGDSIAVVAFGDDAKVVLPPTRATDEETILEAIDEPRARRLDQPRGRAPARLLAGPRDARPARASTGSSLASDGVANVGLTDADGILRQIRDDASAGIQLVAVGVGMGNYNDALLEQLADQGDGFYAYVNDLDRGPAAVHRGPHRDAPDGRPRCQGPGRVRPRCRRVVSTARLREPRHRRPRLPRSANVDAGAIGAGHEVTALYDIRLRDGSSATRRCGTVRLRWTEPGATRGIARFGDRSRRATS